MSKNLNLYRDFTKKMFWLALAIGIFVATNTPVGFWVFGTVGEKAEANYLSRQIGQKVTETVRENPELWIYSLQKFTEIFSEVEKGQMSRVRIFDAQGRQVFEEVYGKPSVFDTKGRADIVYNNKYFGYIEVNKIGVLNVQRTVGLLVVFSLLGIGLALVLYRFPAGIIKKAELEIDGHIERLNHLSYHDPLTQLRNRTYLNEILPVMMAEGKHFALIFMDLDNFKYINDSFGHSFGDLLLKEVGMRLKSVFREDDILIRLGGDEFMIILPYTSSAKLLHSTAKRLMNSFSSAISVNENELYVTTSLGIAMYPEDGEDMAVLVKNADIAMYAAKEQGKNKYCFYDKAMSSVTIERLKMEGYLSRAVERGELILYFQPKFDIYDLRLTGCEVLLRWFQPELGMISPGVFIPLAEDTGLIIPIGEWVLLNSFRQIKAWVDKYDLTGIRFSVNISPLQFHQENLIPFIKEALEETGLDPEYIEVEITESVAMQNAEEVYYKLGQIRALGIEISIDDFGTGYSSMSYLEKFPINTLKIAMPFVKDIKTDRGSEAIVSAIIAIARSLNLKVIAEGIETKEQLEVLREKNCDYGQGYLYSKPVPTMEFEGFIDGTQEFCLPAKKIAAGV